MSLNATPTIPGTMVVDTLKKHAPSTGHKDNHHGIPTYWSKSGHTLQKFITALATCDFLLFGFDVSESPTATLLSKWCGIKCS